MPDYKKISELDLNATPTTDDQIIILNDPSGTPGTQKAAIGTLPFPGASAAHTHVDAASGGTITTLGTLGTKATPVDADLVTQRDSEDSSALVTSTWTQIKAFLKTYFDTVYAAVLGADDNYVTDTEKTNITTLTDNSIADTLHRHSELVASDGSPDPAVSVGASGVTIFKGNTNGLGVFEADTLNRELLIKGTYVGATGSIGNVRWVAKDSAGNDTAFGQITVEATDVANGSEDSSMRLYTTKNGSMGEKVTIDADGNVSMPVKLSVGAATGVFNNVIYAQGGAIVASDDGTEVALLGHNGTASYVGSSYYSGAFTPLLLQTSGNTGLEVAVDGGILMPLIKSGTTQVAAGAAANELWKTSGHATLPDNVILIGV